MFLQPPTLIVEYFIAIKQTIIINNIFSTETQKLNNTINDILNTSNYISYQTDENYAYLN